MNLARRVLSTLRWRLIPVRYAGKLARTLTRLGARLPQDAANDTGSFAGIGELRVRGFTAGPTFNPDQLAAAQAVYGPRAGAVEPRQGGHPFVNLFTAEDIDPLNPVFRFAVSHPVIDAAHAYFGGRYLFDSIQVLHSWPTHGPASESQLWHKDYGDSSSLHCIGYLNDVLVPADGPFVFADRVDSARIGRSVLIRRINDETFARELGEGQVRSFFGKAGETVLVDPSACYHYGSRCEKPRLAVFVTFSTDRPFVAPQAIIRGNAKKAARAAAVVRPDLPQAYLDNIFGV